MTAMATGFGNGTNWAFEGMWGVLAILTHAALIGGMPKPPDRSGLVALGNSVDMSFIEEEPEPEEVEEPEPVKPPPKRKTFRAAKKPSPPKEPPAAAQETPVAFDNVVLTDEGDGDSSWSAEQASGKSVEGPIGSPNAAVTGQSKKGVAGGVIGGTGRGVVIDTGDLSRELVAPPLNRTLERLEPKKAGAESVEGEAFVRLQIRADGVVSNWHVMLEYPTGYELGQACIKTLKREAWKAQVDKDGKPFTTRIIYRCGYEIRY
jgi:hypothetical protein